MKFNKLLLGIIAFFILIMNVNAYTLIDDNVGLGYENDPVFHYIFEDDANSKYEFYMGGTTFPNNLYIQLQDEGYFDLDLYAYSVGGISSYSIYYLNETTEEWILVHGFANIGATVLHLEINNTYFPYGLVRLKTGVSAAPRTSYLYYNSTATEISENRDNYNLSEGQTTLISTVNRYNTSEITSIYSQGTDGQHLGYWGANGSIGTSAFSSPYYIHDMAIGCGIVSGSENAKLLFNNENVSDATQSQQYEIDVTIKEYTDGMPNVESSTPDQSYPLTIDGDQYNETFTFHFELTNEDYWRHDPSESVKWYWDTIPLTGLSDQTQEISIATLPASCNCSNGTHHVRAEVLLTCGITLNIFWDITLEAEEYERTYVTGYVYTEEGSPIANTTVELYNNQGTNPFYYSNVTDPDGRFYFSSVPICPSTLPPYLCNIKLEAKGNDNYLPETVTLGTIEGWVLHNFWLSARENLTLDLLVKGRSDPHILPLTSPICYLTTPSENYTIVGDSNGRCRWDNSLQADTYNLKIEWNYGDKPYCSHSETLVLTNSTSKEIILNPKLVLVGGTVYGKNETTTTDLEDAAVNFYLIDHTGYGWYIATATTDSSGYYEIENLQEGNYTITIVKDGYGTKSFSYLLNGSSCDYQKGYGIDFTIDQETPVEVFGSAWFSILDAGIENPTNFTDQCLYTPTFRLWDDSGDLLVYIENNVTLAKKKVNLTYETISSCKIYIEALTIGKKYTVRIEKANYVDYYDPNNDYVEFDFYGSTLDDFAIWMEEESAIPKYTVITRINNDEGNYISFASVKIIAGNYTSTSTTNGTGHAKFTDILRGDYQFYITHPAHNPKTTGYYYIQQNITINITIIVKDEYIPTTTIATCSDNIQNGDETGVDCGGSCPNCMCFYNWDCAEDGSEICDNNECITTSCSTDPDCVSILWKDIDGNFFYRDRECVGGECRFLDESTNDTLVNISMTIKPLTQFFWNDSNRIVYVSNCEQNTHGFTIITNNPTRKWFYHADPSFYSPFVSPTNNIIFGSGNLESETTDLLPKLCEIASDEDNLSSLVMFQSTDSGSIYREQSVYTLTFRDAFKITAEYTAEDVIGVNITRKAICFHRNRTSEPLVQINTNEEAIILFNGSTTDPHYFFCNNTYGESGTAEYGGGARSILLLFWGFFVIFLSKLYIALVGSAFVWHSWYIILITILIAIFLPLFVLIIIHQSRPRQNGRGEF